LAWKKRIPQVVAAMALAVLLGQVVRSRVDRSSAAHAPPVTEVSPPRPALPHFLGTEAAVARPVAKAQTPPKSRDPAEWQGMPLDPSTMPGECGGPRTCGLALACVESRCMPCERDADCAPGESCAVQHCVLTRLSDCRSRRDCASGELCVLSGYSADPRGNADMRSYCLAPQGGIRRADVVPYKPNSRPYPTAPRL
jgi:hypothetical protein